MKYPKDTPVVVIVTTTGKDNFCYNDLKHAILRYCTHVVEIEGKVDANEKLTVAVDKDLVPGKRYSVDDLQRIGARFYTASLKYFMRDVNILHFPSVSNRIYPKGVITEAMNNANPKKTVQELLDEARPKVYKKFKTAEACAQQLAKVNVSGKSFDDALSKMQKAAQDRSKKKISTTEFNAIIKTQKAAIKEPLNVLMLNLNRMAVDIKDIGKDEIKMLRDYIRGLKKIFNEHLRALNKKAKKPVTESMIEAYEATYAIENDGVLAAFEGAGDDFGFLIPEEVSDSERNAMEAFALACESMKVTPNLD